MSDKPIKDMTPEEREAFFQSVRENLTQEQREAMTRFAEFLTSLAEPFHTEEGKKLTEGIIDFFKELPAMLSAIQEVLNADKEKYENLTLDDLDEETLDKIFQEAEKLAQTKSEKEAMREGLAKLTSIIPRTHVIPISKVAQKVTQKNFIDGKQKDVDVSRGTNGKTLVRCLMDYNGKDVIMSTRHALTEYDRCINDTVASLYVYGNDRHVFTPDMLCRSMMGMTEKENPSPQQVAEAVESLERQAAIRVKIDCTAQLKAQGITTINGQQIGGGKFTTNLLMLEALEIEAGGRKVTAYQILKPPIMYEYSAALGEVANVPLELLDIRETYKKTPTAKPKLVNKRIRNSARRIAIKEYLLRRISIMKGPTKQTNRITLDTLLTEAMSEPQQPTAKERRNCIEYVYQVLDYWQAQGFITGYKRVKKGNAVVALDMFW